MNYSSRLLTSLPVATILALTAATQVYAQPTPTPTPATEATRLAAVIAKGNSDITTRTTALTALIAKVTAGKKLTATQKTDLTTEMQGEITGLGTLKTTLDADTTAAAARLDFARIFSEHYVFAFYIPRTDRIIAADNLDDAAIQLTALVPKLQGYITQAQTAGNTVAALNASLATMQADIKSGQTVADSVINTLTPLKASGYPGNKTTVQAGNVTLKTGYTNIDGARAAAKSIVASLKKMIGKSS